MMEKIRDRMDTLMMLHLIGVPPDKVPEIESMLSYWMAQAAEKQEQIESLWEQLEQRDKDYVTLHDAVNKVITETNEMGTLFDAFQSATQDRFRLQQELNAMRQNYNSALAIINENQRHLDELNKLKAEVEIMRADVRRYRRLRDRGADMAVHVAVLTKNGGYCPKGHDCDAAIDSVMYLESLPCGRSLS
jgi:chromosome segregation ATPase